MHNCELTLNKLGEGSSHDVYVFYSREVEFDVFVISFILITLSSCTVGHGVDLRRDRKKMIIATC